MELEVGKLGATRQTWRSKTVREVLTDIVSQYPNASETRLRKEFRTAVRNDDDYFDAVCDYAFDNAYRARVIQQAKAPPSAENRAERLQQRATEAKEHAARVKFVKEQIILLNQEMPNGKRARYCTLDYLYRLGGKYKSAGKNGSSKLVGQQYSEQEYRAKLSGVA